MLAGKLHSCRETCALVHLRWNLHHYRPTASLKGVLDVQNRNVELENLLHCCWKR